MRNIHSKELKIKFVETLNFVDGFEYEEGNPFLIKIGSNRFFIFLKNISPAYFVNSPDITRVQLPFSKHFKKALKTNIPFCILGYDVDNDTFVSWNPQKLKDRLNAKSNVSLYSRNSLQKQIKIGDFRAGYLSNGEKIVVFDRRSLPLFFKRLSKLFKNNEIDVDEVEVENEENLIEGNGGAISDKLFEINDPNLLSELKPLLKKNKVLEAVGICSKFYGGKYKNMNFKDWFKIIRSIHQKSNS